MDHGVLVHYFLMFGGWAYDRRAEKIPTSEWPTIRPELDSPPGSCGNASDLGYSRWLSRRLDLRGLCDWPRDRGNGAARWGRMSSCCMPHLGGPTHDWEDRLPLPHPGKARLRRYGRGVQG